MDVKVEIFAKNLEITDAIKGYIDKKAAKLDRFLKEIGETRIDITYAKSARGVNERFSAQVTLRGRGFILRAEERSNDLYSAVDLVMDKIERQIERYKGKKYRSLSPAKRAVEIRSEAFPEDDQTIGEALIARRKKFKLTPMTEMEALEQMNMLGHEDFFIFYDAKSNKISVLYRRRDGNYGIIEPELE